MLFSRTKTSLPPGAQLVLSTRPSIRLELFPERGRPSGTPGIRELIVPFGRSAYLLRYVHLAAADEVVILRVWHAREERK
jgi:plasmid stabilization system protein ParE